MSITTEQLNSLLSNITLSSDQGAEAEDVDGILTILNSAQPETSMSRMITNDVIQRDRSEAIGQPVTFIQPAPVFNSGMGTGKVGASIQKAENPFENLNSTIDSISKLTTGEDKFKALIALEASTGEYISKKTAEARKAAESQLGIEKLKLTLAQNEKLDRADVNWAQNQSDSPMTAKIRANIAQAESQIDRHTQALLREDGELARYVKTVEGFGAMTRGNIQKQELKEITNEQNLAKRMEKERDFLATIPPEVRASFIKDNPNNKDDSVFIANFLTESKDAKNTGYYEQLRSGTVRPDNYFQVGLQGNPIALRLTAAEQADRTGIPKDIVQKQLTTAYNMVNDETAFLKMAPQILSSKDLKAYSSAKMLEGKDVEGQKQLKNIRIAAANNYMSALQKDYLASDVTNWSRGVGEASIDQEPGAATIIQELKAKTGKVSVTDFVKAYTSQPGLTPAEVAQRMDIIAKKYRTALGRVQQNGIYGTGIDIEGEVQKAKAAAVGAALERSVAMRAGAAVGDGIDVATKYQPPVNRLMSSGFNTLGSTLRDFSRGVLGE